ncbi:BMP family ABC transporter substrate-binding protein [Microbacterium protaetiae]|uniref:BMP family ABC transporter substrate-binding protein n=1 Tax=Microbacterium protaetiae TaxID=2509458 RepID=A0A4P6EFF3_9MICO|nr:BMP family ABC transporter substrate-binding protein [Microbacterium protaetiae]QAY58827.1 BMP family ABC transporter substrate-binding protein [Microbacterium protaetiae]
MTISSTRKLAGITVAAGLIVALAGCGAAPEATTPTNGGKTAVEGFKPCIVSDDGGWNDKSFNESAKNGIDKAASELGVDSLELESSSESDYAPNLASAVSQNCTLIISVGFKLSADTVKTALAHPDLSFAIIDDAADNTGAKDADGNDIGDGKTDAPNIKPILFNTVEAAYLGGYAAAAWSHQDGVDKVGTFGGLQIPSVAIFMDGFIDGVKKFNDDNSANVATYGWDVDAQKGSFTGGFTANDTAKQTAQGILDQGVDVILPVGGPIYKSAAAAIKDSGKDTVMLGVDSDLAVADPSVADVTLVSIMKRIDQAVYDTVMSAATGDFDVTPYIGTLENEGVGLSSFHDFESKLPEGLTDKIADLQKQIISGDLKVTSANSPTK